MASIKDRRKKFMEHLIKVMDLLDPSGQNSKNYHAKFDTMTDAQFDAWAKDFFNDEKQNFYLEIVEYERDLTIEQIEKAAAYMRVPLFERVAIPYLTHDKDNVVITPEPVPVGYTHQKRMPQTLLKKSAGSIKIDKRNPLTGQVTGEDKNARNTDTETYSLIAVGAENCLREMMGPRADDMKAKTQMYNQIAKNGYVSLEDLDNDPKNKTALNTFDVYFAYQMFLTNLVTPLDEIPTM